MVLRFTHFTFIRYNYTVFFVLLWIGCVRLLRGRSRESSSSPQAPLTWIDLLYSYRMGPVILSIIYSGKHIPF